MNAKLTSRNMRRKLLRRHRKYAPHYLWNIDGNNAWYTIGFCFYGSQA